MTGYRSTAEETSGMPRGIPYIIGNEAAERFSFYGMKSALVIFMVEYLHLMGATAGDVMNRAAANEYAHYFVMAVYLTPLLGAFISDRFWGKYKTIILLSLVYCSGHAALAVMGIAGPAAFWLIAGLGLIALGSGGIKPCVSAHVGDQFGKGNAHLLTKIFNWFYFSINLGAALSNLLIPWLLKWHGPHWAFGIPGTLMAVATLLFWMGRHRFVHIPAAGQRFTDQLKSPEGKRLLLKLFGIFLFIAVFWSLFDQTASSWVFQAIDMDRNLFGFEILPSQVQAANPFLILILIPIFTYGIYPLVNRWIPLTPLRKIGAGLFLTAVAFGLSALIQEWIDAGEQPSIAWQLLAYGLLTSAEVMVSIVCLEFAYTQAPKSMKSTVMSLFFVAVALGNLFTALVNGAIQVPSPLNHEAADALAALESGNAEPSSLKPEWKSLRYAGLDGGANTSDDVVTHFDDRGVIRKREVPSGDILKQAANRIEEKVLLQDRKLLKTEDGQALLADLKDEWGQPLTYRLLNGSEFRITSAGPDKKRLTQWDIGITVHLEKAAEIGDAASEVSDRKSWLEIRKEELGVTSPESGPENDSAFSRHYFSGGLFRLEGAAYFWFFTVLMLITAVIFVPVSMRYRKSELVTE